MLADLQVPEREKGQPTGVGDGAVVVRSLDEQSAHAWDRFVLEHSDGTFFHLTSWMRVIQETFGYAPYYFYCQRGERITAVVPLFRVDNWITGDCLISSPFAVSGGICAADEDSEFVLLEHIQHLARQENTGYLELRSEKGKLYQGFHPNELYSIFTKKLSHDPEANFKALPNDTRYMIRRGTRAGLTTRRGLDQMGIFYRLFSMNMHHHGTPMFPRSLFDSLLKHVENSKLDILVTYLGEEPVAAVLSFFYRDTVLPYYAGIGTSANKLGANNFMYWDLMKYAAEIGYSRFDFGRSKKGTGAFTFKSHWNMEVQSLNYQVYLVKRKDPPNNSPLNPKFRLATELWQKLPLWAANLVGPHLVKWFP